MVITGIDLSYRNCGVATVEYNRSPEGVSIVVMKQEVIKTVFQGRDWEGLLHEIPQIRMLIERLAKAVEGSDCVLVELPTMGGKPDQSSVRTAGICYGVTAAAESISGKQFTYIRPSDLKLWSGRKSNKKEHVEAKVRNRLGSCVLTNNDNIIDALGLCLMKCDQLSYDYHQRNPAPWESSDSRTKQEPSRGNDHSPSELQLPLLILPSDPSRPKS